MVNRFLYALVLFKSVLMTEYPDLIPVFTFKQYPDNKVLVFIGDQPIQFRATIDLINQSCCFVINKYTAYSSSANSVTRAHKQLLFEDTAVEGMEMEDLFSFEDDNIGPQIKLRFDYIGNNPSLYHLNRISLPFVFNDEAYSIIHRLKLKGVIKHLSFSRVELNLVTYFYFGGIPVEYSSNKTTVSHCDVIGRNGYWDCSLREINIRNDKQSFTYTPSKEEVVIFDFAKVFIYAPSKFIDFLITTFFKETIDKGYCLITDNNTFRRISCRIDAPLQKSRMTFAIGDYSYTIDLEQLLKCSLDRCFLEVIDHPDGHHWQFGTFFFESFDVLLDYELKKIFFYSDKGVEVFIGSSRLGNSKRVLCNLCCIVLMCGILSVLLLRTKLK